MDKSEMSEHVGETLAAAQLYALPCARSILRIFPDDVEDVLQDAAVRALSTRSKFRGESSFNSWFTKIVIRTALIRLRASRSAKAASMVSLEDVGRVASRAETPEQAAAREERAAMLRVAISELSPKKRLGAYGLLRGEPCSDSTDKARRFYARRKLREILGKRMR